MSRALPPHHELNPNKPHLWNGNGYVLEVTLDYEPDLRDPDQMIFVFNVRANWGGYSPSSQPMSFEIDRDCIVVFKLSSSKRWKWSSQYHMISGKSDLKKLYGCVNWVGDREFYLYAKYNEDLKHHPKRIQKFNLNIDYGQDGGRWLPITVDPDVGNPKPDRVHGVDGEASEFKFILSGSVELSEAE